MEPEAQIRQTIEAYRNALNALDPDAYAQTFAENAVSLDPANTPPKEGRDAMRQHVQFLRSVFTQMNMTIGEVFICGSDAAFQWSAQATTQADKRVAYAGIDVFTMNADGKIQTSRGFWDLQKLLAQLNS